MNPDHPSTPGAASSGLHLLLERETAERDLAIAALQQAQQQLQSARRQGEQLAAYRDDYQRRWSAQFGRSGSVEILRCYQGFSERLNQAIDQQRAAQAQAEQREAGARESLTAQELRVASVRKLIERRDAEARRAEQRRDQQRSDESAQRSAAHGPSWRNDGLSAAAW